MSKKVKSTSKTGERSSTARPYFRELEPVGLWSVQLVLRRPYDTFKAIAARVAEETEQRLTGFITQDENGDVTTFTRTRYPRRKYSVLKIAECLAGTVALASALDADILPDPDNQGQGIRVVLELREGYDPHAPQHSISEVEQALPAAQINPATIFAVKNTVDTPYTEPAGIIKAPMALRDDMYALGDAFLQERFTVDDFERGISYIVETRHCTKPDP